MTLMERRRAWMMAVKGKEQNGFANGTYVAGQMTLEVSGTNTFHQINTQYPNGKVYIPLVRPMVVHAGDSLGVKFVNGKPYSWAGMNYIISFYSDSSTTKAIIDGRPRENTLYNKTVEADAVLTGMKFDTGSSTTGQASYDMEVYINNERII